MNFNQIISFIFIFIIKYSFQKPEILKIPFKTKTLTSKDSITYLHLLTKNYIYTEIKIGKNNEKIPVSLKLQSYPIYFISEELNTKYKFNYKQSSSFEFIDKKLIETATIEDFTRSIKSKDKISINSISEKFIFLLAKNLTTNKDFYFGGQIGFELQNQGPSAINGINFMTQLKENKLIPHTIFSINYNDNEKGEIIIGDFLHNFNSKYNNQYFVKTHCHIDEEYTLWEILFNKINYGNETIKEGNHYGLFKVELGGIIGPTSLLRILNESFFDDYVKNQQCFFQEILDENNMYKYNGYYCKNNINIKLMKNIRLFNKDYNYTFELNPNELFIKNNNFYFFLIYFDHYPTDNWILGKPFLKKYQLTFDIDGRTIGFYTNINKNGKDIYDNIYDKKTSKFTTIALIFCILIIIGLVAFIFFYLRKRQLKKRNANELDDDFSYIPKNDKITKLINGIEN